MKDKRDQMVTLDGDHPTTNTLIIAEYFGKSHKNVLQSLRDLIADCSEDFGRLNFQPTPYYDSQGKKQTMYSLTRDGFMLLSMGFTGANATRLKIAFIEEFNRMEAALHHPLQRPGQIEELQASRAKDELLKAKPLWAKIARYVGMGLSGTEIGLLLSRDPATIGKHRRRMEACGIITPPANLARMREMGLTLIGGQHVH